MAHPGGVEPPTSRLTVERSNHTELWVNLNEFKDVSSLLPPEGLEPSTFRLEVYCASNCAKGDGSHAGTRTRVARVKGGYPDHLDYMGL